MWNSLKIDNLLHNWALVPTPGTVGFNSFPQKRSAATFVEVLAPGIKRKSYWQTGVPTADKSAAAAMAAVSAGVGFAGSAGAGAATVVK